MTAQPALVIAGLRRSGTTALWEVLRSTPGLVAFDEPFHPRLWTGARENPKGTWRELTALWQAGPGDLVPGVTPIAPLDELASDLTPAQVTYARALVDRDRPVVVDVVRLWNKMAALAAATPGAHLVQLVRSPVPWALSHLIPSGGEGWRFALGSRLRRATALSRRAGFDNWQYETILTAALERTPALFAGMPIPTPDLAGAPAHVKLLAFWWAANRESHRQLRAAAPDRYDLVLAEDFMTDPAAVVGGLASHLGLDMGVVDLGSVRPPRGDALQDRPEWARAFAGLGIPATLLPGAAPDSATLRRAFDGAAG